MGVAFFTESYNKKVLENIRDSRIHLYRIMFHIQRKRERSGITLSKKSESTKRKLIQVMQGSNDDVNRRFCEKIPQRLKTMERIYFKRG